jgi:putative membrane protein
MAISKNLHHDHQEISSEDGCQDEPEHHHHISREWLQQWVQTLIVYLLGAYFVYLALPGGNLDNYVNTQLLGWLTWVGAAAFFVMALVSTNELRVSSRHHSHHDHHHDHPHTAGIGSWLMLAVLALPFLLGWAFPSKPLGGNAVSELSTDVTSFNLGSSQPSIEIPSGERNILDWLRVLNSSANLREFEGQEIEVIGFVYRDAQIQQSDQFMAARFALSCCVADARALGMVVQDAKGAALPQDTWVKVSGHIEIQHLNGIDTPVIMADAVEVIEPPAQPYLYL